MQIVALRNRESYWHKPNRSDAEGALKSWFAEAKLAQWTCPQDVKNQYANASIIANWVFRTTVTGHSGGS